MIGVRAGAAACEPTVTGGPGSVLQVSCGKILCPLTSGGETAMLKFPPPSVLPVPSTVSSLVSQTLSSPQSTISMQSDSLGIPLPLT